jgi:hypothetical protein
MIDAMLMDRLIIGYNQTGASKLCRKTMPTMRQYVNPTSVRNRGRF